MSLAADYSSCQCDYDASPEFMETRVRKARKSKPCSECRCPIEIGEQYEQTAGKWEGDFLTFNTCFLCADLRRWAQISVPCFCYTFGEVIENVHRLVDEARRDMPAGWIFEWGR